MNKNILRIVTFFLALLAGIVAPSIFAAAAYDLNGMIRKTSDGNVTATANTTGLLIDSAPLGTAELFLKVNVPQATGTTPTLDIVIQSSADNSTWQTVLTIPQITAAGVYRQKYASNKKYVRAALTVGGTTPNFGAVQIGFDTGSEYTG